MDRVELLESLARLAEVHGALARAHDPEAFLRAVGGALAPFGPAHIDLAYVHLGADGQPEQFEVVASWAHGDLAASPIVGGNYPVAAYPLAELMLRTRDEPQFLPALAAEPALAEVMVAVGRTVASAAILPLFSARDGTWQGVVGVYWTDPRGLDEREHATFLVLMHMFAEALASERSQRALREAYDSNEVLLQRTAATLRETEAQKAMLRVLLDNLPLGVAVVHSGTGQRELINQRGALLLESHVADTDGIDASNGRVFVPGEETPIAPEQLPHAVTLATGETHSAELEIERQPGVRALLEVTTSLLRYPGDPTPRVILIYQDITDIRRRDIERMRAQEALLAAQERALVERSTPLLPIRDDVLVMPIVGSIDEVRGRQLLETLVQLGGSARVRATIVDITGVRELDAAAAGVLVGAAQALRLRGVRPILTGVQPAVASTLVGLGVDLKGIQICGTLQDAVAHASLAPDRRGASSD